MEIDRLHEPIGKQDQYIAAYGGITCFTFHPDGSVEAAPLRVSPDTLFDLEDNLLLFFTGYARSAGGILKDQHSRTQESDAVMIENLHSVKEMGTRSMRFLEAGKTADFGALMHEHWLTKKRRSRGMTNGQIDEWYELGRTNGAHGGKARRGGGRGLSHVLRRGPPQAEKRDERRGPRGGPLPLRFRGHEGTVRMTLPLAILAGGLATRLRPLTERIPKILLDIGGEPFIHRQLEDLARHGVTRVVLCVGYLGEMVQETVGEGSRWGMRIEYSFDGDTLLGTGGALRKALPLLGDRFLVLYGDSYLLCDYAAVERAFLSSGKQGIMTVYRNHGKWDTSNVLYNEGKIEIYDKKMHSPEMKHIDYGLGGLSERALRAYDENAPVDLARVYQDLLARDELAAFEVDRRFYEIGSPAGLEELRHHFAHKAGHR